MLFKQDVKEYVQEMLNFEEMMLKGYIELVKNSEKEKYKEKFEKMKIEKENQIKLIKDLQALFETKWKEKK